MIQSRINLMSNKNNSYFYKISSYNKYKNQQIWHYNDTYNSVAFRGKNKNMQTNSSSLEEKIAKINNTFSQKDIKIIASVINKISFYDYSALMQNLETYKYCGDSEASLGYNFDLNNNIASVSMINCNNKTAESEICVVQIEDFSKILYLLKEHCSQKH